jgi:hypothetical protein
LKRLDFLPQLLSVTIAVTGVFLLAACLLDLPFLTIRPPGVFWAGGYAVILIAAGIYFFICARRGKLEPHGHTVAEVRMEAIEKMQSTDLLSRIALEDDDKDVRHKAARRLEEITA